MKHMKKLLVVVAALVMAMAMTATAFAADTHTISVKSTDTHTYKVFQVLTGTMANEGDQSLGNPAWGADAIAEPGDVNAFITSITADGLSDQDIAQLVAAKVNTAADGRGTVDKDHPITGLATGYYVLVDVTEIKASTDGKIDTKALHVVRVVNDIEGIDIKWGTTEDHKVITTDTLGNTENTINGDTDNVSIGDTVNFQITATIPANAKLYNYFYFVINDTLDPGLTLDPDSITVYKESVADTNKLALTTDYLVKTGDAAEPKSFQVGLVDAKSLAGKDIIVTYSAVLNEHATIGEVPNKNTSTVTFSNDPNHDYNGENKNPGFPDQTDLAVTGETPKSVTTTYTTGIEIQKVDENGNVLTGAEFTITGNSTEIVLVSSEIFAEATNGEYYGLKNGTYTKEAPIEDDSMKPAEEGATEGYVEDASATGDGVVTVGGKTYRPYQAGDTGQVYILVKANADQYDGKQYNKTVTYTAKNTKADPAVEAKAEVGADGVVRFVGLGEGNYTITETKTPAGYNTLDPVTVKIKFTANPATGEAHWTKDTGDTSGAAYNSSTGVFEITIQNNKGTELPSTGGMGTTVLYIVGGIMVLLAVVFLITKKRVANKRNDRDMI